MRPTRNISSSLQRDARFVCVCECGVHMSGSGRTDYDEFFTAARPQLVGLAFALTGDIQVAHELAQEALVRAWINWRKIRSYDDPSAWARRVVRNFAANYGRHLRLAPMLPPMENVSAPTTDRLAMIDALAQLPAPQREALVLHDGLGVPVAEVASGIRFRPPCRSTQARARIAVVLPDTPDTPGRPAAVGILAAFASRASASRTR